MGIRHKARAEGHSDRQGETGYRDEGRGEKTFRKIYKKIIFPYTKEPATTSLSIHHTTL